MSHQRSIVVVLSMALALTACGEASQTVGSGGGQSVAPTKGDPANTGLCTISTPEDARPVTAEEAEVLAAEFVGRELDDVETVADTREVCDGSYEVWVVTGTLPNGDDTSAYVTRDGGQIIHGSISGSSD